MKNEDAEALVTGATGFLGRWLLAALTARGTHVAALVRNAPAREGELRAFVDEIGGDSTRLVVVSGDVETPSLGLDVGLDLGIDVRPDVGLARRLSGVRDVYHLAARFAFGITADEARRANVDGTLHTLAWAAALPALRRFVFLGGYRMTRPSPGLQALSYPLSETSRAWLYREHGAYEASKHEAWMAFQRFVADHDIDWTAVHPSGVIGDSRTGRTTQVIGLGETVERLWNGQLPALVGTSRTFVPVVTVDHVASVLATVPEREETRRRELTVLDPGTPCLPHLVREIGAHLHVRAPRHSIPAAIVRVVPRALTGVEPETLGFLTEDRYDTGETEAHEKAMKLARPALSVSLARWTDHLVSTRFGADPTADAGHLVDGVFSVGDPRIAAIVYLHGIPWNGDAWKSVDDRVPMRGARVDLPGMGRSGPTDLDDVAWLDRALAGRTTKAILVGHSLGSGLAVRYAHAHPEKVRGIVLVSPAFLQKPASSARRLTPLVAHVLRRSTPHDLSTRLLPELDPTKRPLPAVYSASMDLRRRGVARRVACALSRASTSEAHEALRHQLGGLGCEVVIVHGERDPLLATHVTHALSASVIHSIDAAGHAPHLTHPDAVATIVATFAARVDELTVDPRTTASTREVFERAP